MGAVTTANIDLSKYQKTYKSLSSNVSSATTKVELFNTVVEKTMKALDDRKLYNFGKELEAAFKLESLKGLDKINAKLQTMYANGNIITKTFGKLNESVRLLKMSLGGMMLSGAFKLLTGGLGLVAGGIKSAFDTVTGVVEGTQEKRYLARQGGTTLRHLEAFDRGAKLGGYQNGINSQWAVGVKKRAASFDYTGALAMLGIDQDKAASQEATSLALDVIRKVQKEILKTPGGFTAVNEKYLAEGVKLTDLLGLDAEQIKAIDFGELIKDIETQFKNLNIDENKRSGFERGLMGIEFAWEDLKSALLQKFLPVFTSAVNSLQKVFSKLSKAFDDDKTIDKLADAMSRWIESFDLDGLMKTLTDTLPTIFRALAIAMLHVAEVFTSGATNKSLKKMREQLELPDRIANMKEYHEQYGQRDALARNERYVKSLARSNVISKEDTNLAISKMKRLYEAEVDIVVTPKIRMENGKRVLVIQTKSGKDGKVMEHIVQSANSTAVQGGL